MLDYPSVIGPMDRFSTNAARRYVVTSAMLAEYVMTALR